MYEATDEPFPITDTEIDTEVRDGHAAVISASNGSDHGARSMHAHGARRCAARVGFVHCQGVRVMCGKAATHVYVVSAHAYVGLMRQEEIHRRGGRIPYSP